MHHFSLLQCTLFDQTVLPELKNGRYICYLPKRHAPLTFNYKRAANRYAHGHTGRNVSCAGAKRDMSKHDRKEEARKRETNCNMTVWFVNRQLGFVWKGWTKRAARPQGGRRQPDSLIWAAWDSGRRDLDWPKSTPQLRYSHSPCLPSAPSRCLSFPLFSSHRVYAFHAAWVRKSDNRKRQSCCSSTFTRLFIPSHPGAR